MTFNEVFDGPMIASDVRRGETQSKDETNRERQRETERKTERKTERDKEKDRGTKRETKKSEPDERHVIAPSYLMTFSSFLLR